MRNEENVEQTNKEQMNRGSWKRISNKEQGMANDKGEQPIINNPIMNNY
jgi:hypothetical protein